MIIEYKEVQDQIPNNNKNLDEYHSNGSYHKSISIIHDISSNESSEYEELKIHSSNGKSTSSMSMTDEEMMFSSVSFSFFAFKFDMFF